MLRNLRENHHLVFIPKIVVHIETCLTGSVPFKLLESKKVKTSALR